MTRGKYYDKTREPNPRSNMKASQWPFPRKKGCKRRPSKSFTNICDLRQILHPLRYELERPAISRLGIFRTICIVIALISSSNTHKTYKHTHEGHTRTQISY